MGARVSRKPLRRSGIAHFIYSSVGSAARQTGVPHFDSKFQVEEHIRRTGTHIHHPATGFPSLEKLAGYAR